MSVTRSLSRAALLALGLSGAASAADYPAAADLKNCARPEWPKEALRLEQQGKVTLEFLVGADGDVRDARILRSSGYPLLDVAAQEGIRRCRFKPATKDGQPIEGWMRMQYVWTLENTPHYDEAALKAMREAAAGGAPDAVLRLARVQLSPTQAAYDPPAALAALRKLAATGNAAAQELLGMTLLIGRSVPPDVAEARKLLTNAATDGLPTAQFVLAGLLLNGGSADDVAAGERWLRLAAQGGIVGAQARLGTRLVLQAGHEQEGVEMLRKAAARSDRLAQAMLGRCYETGTGVQRDYAQALALYTPAAAAGNADAKRGLARLYEQGNGVARDPAAARKLYQEADRASGQQP